MNAPLSTTDSKHATIAPCSALPSRFLTCSALSNSILPTATPPTPKITSPTWNTLLFGEFFLGDPDPVVPTTPATINPSHTSPSVANGSTVIPSGPSAGRTTTSTVRELGLSGKGVSSSDGDDSADTRVMLLDDIGVVGDATFAIGLAASASSRATRSSCRQKVGELRGAHSANKGGRFTEKRVLVNNKRLARSECQKTLVCAHPQPDRFFRVARLPSCLLTILSRISLPACPRSTVMVRSIAGFSILIISSVGKSAVGR